MMNSISVAFTKIANTFFSLVGTIYELAKLCIKLFRGYNGVNRLAHDFSVDKTKGLRVLGNGSSLKGALKDINQKDFDYLVVNRHVLSSTYEELKPSFYVLADPHFFNHAEGLSIVNKVIAKTTWPLILLLPYGAQKGAIHGDMVNIPSNIKIRYYNINTPKGLTPFKNWLYAKNLAMPRAQNVIVAAIYIGISIGYNLIELYGVEHSWLKNLSVNDNNEVCLANPHFYDTNKVKVQTWYEIQHEKAYLFEVLRMYANMFESYLTLRDLANKKSVRVINRTANSYIDAFEKIQ